jgi:aryl-alcohol dehydrogenase-like predicted oxidoreductase
MARDLGMGVTPWSPLARGVLTGKYTRANHGQQKASRGERVTNSLDDRTYAIVDELSRIATQLDTTPSRVALAWVNSRPGVTSTIIGARTIQQLDDNLGGADLALTADHIAKLDGLSTPRLPFPANMHAMEPVIVNGGTSVNGRQAPAWPMTPANDDERF